MTGRSLRYHKRGADGSGKTDCFEIPEQADMVLGAVSELTSTQEVVLDEIEGVGRGYRETTAEGQTHITGGSRSMVVSFYEAEPEAIDPALLPFDWYLAYIIRRAKQHGLDADYVGKIAQQESQVDPDTARSQWPGERLRR